MKFASSTFIEAPAAAVFALLSDPGAVARLANPLIEVVDDRTGPDGIRHVSMRFTASSGTVTEQTTVVSEAVPNTRVVTRSVSRTIRLERTTGIGLAGERTMNLSERPDGTLVEANTDVQVKPLWLNILYRLFFRRRMRVDFEETMAAARSHFFAPEGEAVEHEVSYRWTTSDSRAAKAWLCTRSGYTQFWAALFVLSLPLFFLGVISSLVMWTLGATLLTLVGQSVLPVGRQAKQHDVLLQIGSKGLRLRRSNSDLSSRLLTWDEVTGISRRGRFVVLDGKKMSLARYLPKRAFSEAPEALAALREHAGGR